MLAGKNTNIRIWWRSSRLCVGVGLADW